jgi:hypothetical protein
MTFPSEEEFYGPIQLTQQEVNAAMLEGKKKKFFKERGQDYWEEETVVVKGKTKIAAKGSAIYEDED